MSALELSSKRITLAILTEDEAELVREYMLENREHLEPWEPSRNEEDFTVEEICERLRKSVEGLSQGIAYQFGILDNWTRQMIGFCNFNNGVRCVFQEHAAPLSI